MKKHFILISMAFLMALLPAVNVSAQLIKTSDVTLENSEQSYSRRLYSYDFDVSPDGTVHAVYALPVVGQNKTQIIYTSKQVGGQWPSEANRIVLDGNGLLGSISTFLIYDKNSDTVNVCYITQSFQGSSADGSGTSADGTGLVYQTIKGGVPGPKVYVSPGGFNTRMQLDANGNPVFAREYQVFLNPDGSCCRSQPFPGALRILVPTAGSTNKWTSNVLNLPANSAQYYRLAGFVYDTAHKRYHILWGDHNAVTLSSEYPSQNNPVTAGVTAVYFPPGAGHKLWYAYSDDLTTWTSSEVDSSGNISENEFWTDMITDSSGTPWVASYRYATDSTGRQEGTSNIIGNLTSGNTWAMETVEGKTTGASPARAGASSKLLVDSAGRFHGVWDDSPDKPIDADGADGNIMYRFSTDGKNWAARQALLPYSAEGQCRAKIYNNTLLLMVLGDFRNARLAFSEFIMPSPTDNLIDVTTDKMFYAPGETITLNTRYQGPSAGDYYLVAYGPFNVNSSACTTQSIPTTQYSYYGPDGGWHVVSDISQARPFSADTSLSNSGSQPPSAVAGATAPFNYSGSYSLASFFLKPGTTLNASDLLAPVCSYGLHICSQAGCSEL